MTSCYSKNKFKMLKKFSFNFFKILKFFDLVLYKITKRNFIITLNEFISNNSYKSIKILNNNISFFTPNKITEWRINTFFQKEPETLEWIDSFESKNKIPHVTMAVNINSGGKPVMSNDIKDWKMLETPIKLVGEVRELA